MSNNSELTKALNIIKTTCEEYFDKGGCIQCPLGYDVSQNGGDNCKLSHNRPKNLKINTPNWKAI